MSELSPAARALIDAAKNADAPSAEDKLRVQDSLYAKLGISAAAAASTGAASAGGNPGPSSLLNASSATTAGAGAGGVGLATKIGLAVVAIAGLTVGGYYATRGGGSDKPNGQAPSAALTKPAGDERVTTPSPRPSGGRVGEGGPKVRANANTKTETETETDSGTDSEKPVVAPKPKSHPRHLAHKRRVAAPKKPKLSPMDRLRAEKKLISQAQATLRDGDATRTLQLLAVHASKFPNGILVANRYGLRVLALCKLGRTEEAKRTATIFLRRWPRYPMADRIRHSCGN